MKVQVTVVVTDGHHAAQVDSTTLEALELDDIIVANAARAVARRLGLGKPTPEKEGGRG